MAALVVNLTNKQSPVIDQGDRPTCLAAATTGGHEYLRDRLLLSIEHLFWNAVQRSGAGPNGARMEEIRDGVVIDGQCENNLWPYGQLAATPKPDTIPAVHRLARGQVLPASLTALRLALDGAYGLAVGVNLNRPFLLGREPIDVGAPGEQLYGLHAVLAVGYDDTNRLAVVKNSWGVDWGEDGYARLTYDYLERYGTEMLRLEP